MSESSKIQWTDSSWNPTRGCTKIAPGCKHCYAATFAERFRGVAGHPYELGFDPRTAPDKLTEPLKWKKPRRIFVDSMSDLFHEAFSFDYIAAVFGVMAACADREMGHTFQILTKRQERAVEFFRWLHRGDLPQHVQNHVQSILHEAVKGVLGYNHPQRPAVNLLRGWPLPNVWIGTSIAEQKDADRNIPHLLKIPAVVRFLSVEPLIGPIEFSDVTGRSDAAQQWGKKALNGIGWVIVGGESGPKARPCNVEWIRAIVEQCQAASVPVFVKQLGVHVIDRNDAGFEGDLETYLDEPSEWTNPSAWPHQHAAEDRIEHLDPQNWQGAPVRVRLRSRKGDDMDEWPVDLRIRNFPEVAV